MDGKKIGSVCGSLLLLLVVAGCSHLPGMSVAAPVVVAPTQLPALTVALGDVPLGYRLAVDEMPTNAQVAQNLAQPLASDTLMHLGRTAGTYRVFTFTAPEPGVFNATVRAVIEVDLFPTAANATAWIAALQLMLGSSGAEMTVAAPGQHHHVRVQSGQAGDTIATTTILDFTEGNAAVEITTVFVGPNVSIADAERFAAIVDDHIKQGG